MTNRFVQTRQINMNRSEINESKLNFHIKSVWNSCGFMSIMLQYNN